MTTILIAFAFILDSMIVILKVTKIIKSTIFILGFMII